MQEGGATCRQTDICASCSCQSRKMAKACRGGRAVHGSHKPAWHDTQGHPWLLAGLTDQVSRCCIHTGPAGAAAGTEAAMAAASLVQVGGRHDQIVVCQHHCIISADLRTGQDGGYWTAGRKICESVVAAVRAAPLMHACTPCPSPTCCQTPSRCSTWCSRAYLAPRADHTAMQAVQVNRGLAPKYLQRGRRGRRMVRESVHAGPLEETQDPHTQLPACACSHEGQIKVTPAAGRIG